MSAAAEVAANLLARLGQITRAKGYATDIGANVFWGRINPPRLAQFVGLYEFEEDDVLDQKADGMARLRVPFVIEAQAECEADRPNETGHALVADIKRGIFGPGLQLAGTINDIRYVGRKILPRDEGSKRVVVEVRIEVTMTENLFAP